MFHSENPDPEGLFRSFVSKLSLICDSRRHGYTVTACTVLQRPDDVLYVFASNRRTSPVELEMVQGYIHAVLRCLGTLSETGDKKQRALVLDDILKQILIFNRDRVSNYLARLKSCLEICIELCDNDSTPQGSLSPHRNRIPDLTL